MPDHRGALALWPRLELSLQSAGRLPQDGQRNKCTLNFELKNLLGAGAAISSAGEAEAGESKSLRSTKLRCIASPGQPGFTRAGAVALRMWYVPYMHEALGSIRQHHIN